jgi:CHAT domain-containing protein
LIRKLITSAQIFLTMLKKLLHIVFKTTIMVLLMVNATTVSAETINQLRADREAFIEHFRIYGARDVEQARAIENKLRQLVESSEGELFAQALFELATIQRINNEFEVAIKNYERAVVAAEKLPDSSLAFDAWLGIARSHAYGTRNHGAAATAFQRAVATTGTLPTIKQRYDLADYASQLQAGRGELEAALLNGIQATQLAQDDAQRFYAFLDTGDVLQKFAESCDYRKLVDAKTYSEDDSWGACKRAVDAAKTYYERARKKAEKLGWRFLEKEVQDYISRLDMRLFIIKGKASFEQLVQAGVFTAQDVRDVLVNENFSSGGSELSDSFPIGSLIAEVLAESQADDPRSIYLRGIKADLDNNPMQALDYFQRAAKLLSTERSSLFDLRQRGTVVESRPELFRDLGLRLLSIKQYDEAFVVFESIRSRGLGGLAAAFIEINFTQTERQWIADLVQLDSLASATQNALVETTIAGIEHSRSLELLDRLNHVEQRRREQQERAQFQTVINKLASVEYTLPTMTQLQKIVDKTNIPVLLYWITHTNVVVWVVSPEGVEVKTVLLPEVAVIDKVSRLLDSVKTKDQEFDEKSAKELYAYLIKPFAKFLSHKQVVIIPQGPLVGLPFEVLIDADTGKYLAENLSVSYAPNAAFAMRMLEGGLPDVSKVTAIYDEVIDKRTQEISKIKSLKNVQVEARPSKGMDTKEVIKSLGHAGNVHVLLHGMYNYNDALQSSITTSEEARNRVSITAAELLAVDWRNTQLAVFSSCEGALVKSRISNELFGISWALLAGGVNHVVLSRWRVNEASNATWMETFYKSLSAGQRSPALAANAAMRKMISSSRRHPYYWAGPQVFGR